MNILVISNQFTSGQGKICNPVINTLNENLIREGVNIDKLSVDTNNYGFGAYIKLFFSLLLKRIKILLKIECSPDVVHVHFGGLQSMLVSLFFSRNLVISFHGTDLHGGTPRNYIGKVKSKVNVLFSYFSALRAKRISVVSTNLLEHLPVCCVKRTAVIPTGVDFNKFKIFPKEAARVKLNIELDHIQILFSDISNSTVKRRDIAEAVVDSLSNFYDAKLLVMSGVSHEMVPFYLNACDFVLIVSDKEGSPNIVKEALALEKPIFSLDVGDVFEYIKHDPASLMLSSNEPSLISQQIIKHLKENIKHSSRDYWKDKIDIRLISLKYLNLYRSVIS